MNKPSRPLLIGPLLQSFFSEHLCSHKRSSIQTIASYRDTFRLLLSYVQQTTGVEPSALRITDLQVPVMLSFLAHLEAQRDHALLLTMYNSGARVSEITSLSWPQVRFGTTTYLDLKGKGRKDRSVPLWPKTAKVLQRWQQRQVASSALAIFPSLRGNVLTRDSVHHLLREIVRLAIPACPSLAAKRVTPHLVRHYLPFRTMSSSSVPA
jgi:integrase